MKNNIAKILERQNEMNEEFKKHLINSDKKFNGLDYRLKLLEA